MTATMNDACTLLLPPSALLSSYCCGFNFYFKKIKTRTLFYSQSSQILFPLFQSFVLVMSSKIEVSDDAGARARRVWRIDYAGSIGDLKLKTESISKPKSGEIQVQICYCGLNFADIAAVQGLYSATPKGSFIPGLEYSGIVVDVGSDVSFFHIGDQVFGCTKFGGYAEYINIDPCYVRHVPPGWSLKEASAFCCQALTAWYGLVDLGRLKLKSNASDVVKPFAVLIHSGAGGVGLFAGELVLAAGGSPIFTVGDSSKAEFLMSRFASQIKREQIIVRSNSKDFAFDLKTAMTSVGVDSLRIVFDSLLQRASFEASMKVLDKGGYCVIYGAGSMMTGPRDSPNWITLAWRYRNI